MVDVVKEFLRESNLIEDEHRETALEDAIKAWEWALKNYKKEITFDYILKIHWYLMRRINPKIAGKSRNCQVYVGGHEGAPYTEVLDLLEDWCGHWWKSKTEKEIKKAHISFEHIHPFVDGNGRTGRILMNIQRVKAGLPILVIHAGEEQYEYYKWFRTMDE